LLLNSAYPCSQDPYDLHPAHRSELQITLCATTIVFALPRPLRKPGSGAVADEDVCPITKY
jgi:hypothetical protein